jgi:hypothetical protein
MSNTERNFQGNSLAGGANAPASLDIVNQFQDGEQQPS